MRENDKSRGEKLSRRGRSRTAAGGLYQLVIRLPRPRRIRVGSLGIQPFAAGYYLYTGRARRDLERRIRTHLAPRRRRWWHIDYLMQYGRLRQIRVRLGRRLSECAHHRQSAAQGAGTPWVRQFGASDCRCGGHLLYSRRWPLPKGAGEGEEG